MTTLTIVVPCYNSAGYLRRCLDSTVCEAADVEVIVVDDGSTDATAEIAQDYVDRHAGRVRLIRQPNGGHGAAVNTGVAAARGHFVKVVDSDDWLDGGAFEQVLGVLRRLLDDVVDVVLTNFVYEKADRRRKRAVRYRRVLPVGRVVGWEDTGAFATSQYLLMHALIYRTGLLREIGLRLPEHTFYVDNVYAYVPLSSVRRLYYVDADLYRYYIGRADQSVNEEVMLGRIDQYVRVNRIMLRHLSEVRRDPTVPSGALRYLLHYAGIVCATSSVLLTRAGTPQALAVKDELWATLAREDAWLHRRLRRSLVGQLANLPGRSGRGVTMLAYRAAQRVVGFN